MKWDDLTMGQKSALMRIYINNGVTSLDDMRSHYNSFAEGGKTKPPYKEWVKKVNPDFVGPDYNLEAAYNALPFETLEAWRLDPIGNHLPDTYKRPTHSTFSEESVYSQGPIKGGTWYYEPVRQGQYIPRELLVGGINGVEPNPNYRRFDDGGSPDIPPYTLYYATPQYGFSPETSSTNTYNLEAEYRKQQSVKQAQKVKPIREAQLKKQPVITETNQLQINPIAEQQKLADEQAAIFGRSLGANHDMTTNEVLENMRSAAETAGWVLAPTFMSGVTGGYYFGTKRPLEGVAALLPAVAQRGLYAAKNIAFNHDGGPQRIMKAVQDATNRNAQIKVEWDKAIGDIYVPIEMAERLQKTPDFSVRLNDFVKDSDSPIKDLIRYNGYNTGDKSKIRMNPRTIIYKPKNYRGIIAHEAQHAFKYPGMQELSEWGTKYYVPNKSFAEYELLRPFEKAAAKEKWRGSPEELVSEVARMKYTNGIIDKPYYEFSENQKRSMIKNVMAIFKISEADAANTLQGLSEMGYF